MNRKRILVITIAVNLMFLALYFSFTTNNLSAAEDKQQQAPVRKESPQNVKAQWDSLRQREEALRIKQGELNSLERRVDDKMRRLAELEMSVKSQILAYRQLSDERIKHLVKIYSSMKPNAAANLMNQTDTDVAVEVFLNMKGEIAGGILSYMDPQKASLITKKLMSSRSRQASAAPEE
jgi:flagellar motility protein MotE (MotC chaperone)